MLLTTPDSIGLSSHGEVRHAPLLYRAVAIRDVSHRTMQVKKLTLQTLAQRVSSILNFGVVSPTQVSIVNVLVMRS